MLWVRGLIFTVLVPVTVAVLVPLAIDPGARQQGGASNTGWGLFVLGTLMYGLCLVSFLEAGGTPAIFFTRPLAGLIGEEPMVIVSRGLYGFSRNPMYLGVLSVVFGQAVVFGSWRRALYGLGAFFFFQAVIVCWEEPHLRATRGSSYDLYCRTVPRWLGPRRHSG